MASTDDAWRQWGEQDPYFGVLTDERFRKERIAENRPLFYRSGEEYIRSRLERVERALGTVSRGRALDFGCGVGRLTIPLAARFKEAVGVDISPAMLTEAEKAAEETGVGNVSFVGSDEQLSKVHGSFDFVHSYIVLQHIPVTKGMRIIKELGERVDAGGVISLHFSVDRNLSSRGQVSYWLREHVPGFVQLANLKNGQPAALPMMQMNQYKTHKVIALLERLGFDAVSAVTEEHGGVDTVALCARRFDSAR